MPRIEDFFDTGELFEDTLAVAVSNTPETHGSALDFLCELEDSWVAGGLSSPMTERQFKWLQNLAGID